MSSPHISFRLNHYHLAKALRILLTLEPNMPVASLSQMARDIITDWISKHSLNAPLEVAQTDIDAIKLIISLPANQINPYTTIKQIMEQSKQKASYQAMPNQAQQMKQKSAQQIAREQNEERIFNEIRQQALAEKAEQLKKDQAERDKQIDQEIEMAAQSEKRIMHQAPIERETDSVINTVTDFSPPKEWIDEQ